MTLLKQLRTGGTSLYMKLSKETLNRIFPMGRFSSEMHKRYGPPKYWYLSPIGVDLEHQRKGYGGLLIRSMLKRIDNDGLPCFLETQNPVNVEIYKKFDFEITAKEKIPDTNIPHWIMIRQPKKKI